MKKAVIDRIVDGKIAVLLVGEEQRQLNVPIKDLPSGIREGLWLKILLQDEKVLKVETDLDKTEEMKKRISAKRALLLSRKTRKP
ncbi:MAG: DUF3006 domain-containing protein [Bacillota bacterium]|nr:DUF3006 domain-containing protein [Bacillota bacterium]HHU62296.1 DUF3006 domain-containing protein [Natronincola sp.]